MSDSEYGQMRSPENEEEELISTGTGMDDDDDEDEEDRDADSLNIKPPQAVVTHSREKETHGFGGRGGKDKLNSSSSSKDKGKDKKHSKERRHKERGNMKEREHRGERIDREEREEQRVVKAERSDRERRNYTSSTTCVSGNDNGGSSAEQRRDGLERYSKARGNYDRSSSADEIHDARRGYTHHFERSDNSARSNHYYHQHHQQHQHQHYHQQQYHHVQHVQQRLQHHDYYERPGVYHHHSSASGNVDYHAAGRQYNKHSGSGSGNHHDDALTALSGDRERDRNRERRKHSASNDQTVKDAESLEQDLRSRLLSKRHKYVRRSCGGDEERLNERFDDAIEYEKPQKGERERIRSRREKKWDAGGDCASAGAGAGSANNSSVIEVLDSPEVQSGSKNNHKSRDRHRARQLDTSPPPAAFIEEKCKQPKDSEHLARRAKFLAAEREKKLRKDTAREQLQARRVKLRERDISRALSPSAVAASVTAGLNVIKRKIKENDNVNDSDVESKRKCKRVPEKQAMNALITVDVDNDDFRSEHAESELDESGGPDDDSISLSPTPSQTDDDESASESHSDSGAAVSVKSLSSTPQKGKRKRNRKHKKSRDRDSYRSRDNDDDLVDRNDDGDDSQHSYYEKIKTTRKSSKHSGGKVLRDGSPHNNNAETIDSEIESRSASASPIESEDSFYANRKREKREKSVEDESTDPEGYAKDLYRSKINKPSKSTAHKSKKRSKTTHRVEDPPNESPISEGSIKAHRAQKNQKNKLSGSGYEQSGSRSDADSEVGSGDSYYTKKEKPHRRAHRHRRHRNIEKEATKKSKHISVTGESDISPSSNSADSQEDDDDGNNVQFKNGVRTRSDRSSGSGSGIDDDRLGKKSRKRKYSHEANQFLANINDIHMTDLSKEEISNRKGRRTQHSETSAGGNVYIDDDGAEVETVYDDKGVPLPNYYPGIQGCRTVEEFQCLNRIEEGTYGVVYRARDQRTNEIVALKRLKMEKEREGFPITSLREINTLLKGQHPNIVTVREIVVGSNMDKIFIVMDYVEHDLKSLMETMKARKQIFFPGEVKCLTQQLLRAVSHLHDNWILHRDLKTSNLLLSHKGILKVGDFGLAREYGSPLRKYTSLVVTRWYRAPELLLCSPMYSTPIDIWSVGCIFAEFLLMTPYLPGKSDIDQLNRIFRELGTPNEKIWPGYNELPAVQNVLSQNTQFADYPMSNLRKRFNDKVSESGIALLQGLLTYHPKQRLTAEAALDHIYFKELPLPIDPAMFPTWPAKSEMGSARKSVHSPKPPSGGAQFKKLGQDDIAISVGKFSSTTSGGASKGSSSKVVSGIITGNKKTAANTGFVLNAGLDQRQFAMGPGFNLKF